MDRRHLAADDEALTRLFADQIDSLIEADDAAWDRRVMDVLVRAGYTVRT
jgi:hypothetical protein